MRPQSQHLFLLLDIELVPLMQGKPVETWTGDPLVCYWQQHYQRINWVLWGGACSLCSIHSSNLSHECSIRLESWVLEDGQSLWLFVIFFQIIDSLWAGEAHYPAEGIFHHWEWCCQVMEHLVCNKV